MAGRFPRVPDDLRATIKQLYKSGLKTKEIAEKFGLHPTTVSNIANGTKEQRAALQPPKTDFARRYPF
jgi:transposase